MTCTHDWIVDGIADVDDDVMEIDGHLDLRCAACGQRARILRPTYAECWQVTKDWLFDSVAYWRGEAGGRLVMLEVESPPPDDDLLTANDDDDLNPVGTMGWLETADTSQVRLTLRRGNAGEFDGMDHAPTTCPHTWFITGVHGQGTKTSKIVLRCGQCFGFAEVVNPTDDECAIIAKAWDIGLGLEWPNNDRVELRGRLKLPAVADLVNTLDLFADDDDDDDIPF